MTFDRKTVSISEIGNVFTGKTPPTNNPDFYGGNIPFYTPSDMDGKRFLTDTKRSLSHLGASLVKRCLIEPGSVMVSCIGSDMGKVAIAPKHGVTNQQINTICPHEWVDSFYLYYALSPRKQELQTLATGGSAQPILNKSQFCQVEIEIPPLSEQKAIAHILGTLDEKIELNRKTNETLEGIAKALFKSWFIDFDPVRAKVEGRSTGLPDEIIKLFPDSFEDSELGEIPSNWCSKKIADWGQTICGKTPSTKRGEFYGDGYMFVTIPDLHKGLNVTHSTKELTQLGADSQPKKLLSKGSVLVSCIATPGLVGVAKESCFTNQQINSIIPRNKNSTWFLAFFLLMNQDLLLSFGGGGSVFFNLSKGKFDEIAILSPSEKVMDAFSEFVSPLMEKCFYLKEEISTLSQIRDTLLTKLITGELRVPDAEKMLEEVGI